MSNLTYPDFVLLNRSWKELVGSPAPVFALKIPEEPPQGDLPSLFEWRERLAGLPLARFLEEPQWAKTSSRGRRAEWSAGRTCILQVLDALEAAKISPERMRLSLAHADGYALAVGAAADKADRAIGVDFENASRAVSEALMQRLVAEEELEFELDRIGFWVVKEACFKADAKGGGVLSEYRVCRYDPETGRGEARFFGRSSARDGTWKFKFLRSGPWAIALVAGSFSK